MGHRKSKVIEIPGISLIMPRHLWDHIFRAGFDVGFISGSNTPPGAEKIEAAFKKYGNQYLDGIEINADILDQVAKESEVPK